MKGYFTQRGKTWTYRIDLPPDPVTGKRRQKSKGGFQTKKKAQDACAIEIAKIASGEYEEQEKQAANELTTGEYLLLWLKTYAKPNYKPTSYDTASVMIEKRIIPELGSIHLVKLDALTIEIFYEKLKQTYSDEYVKNIHNVLRSALRQAYKWGKIPENIMDKVNAPKRKKKEMLFWTQEEWMHFLDKAKGHPHFIFFAIALRTGMRRGEVLGLRWSDINFEKKTLTVRQTLNHTLSGLIFQTPKTDASLRTINLDKYLIEELQARKGKVNRDKLRVGPAYGKHDLVCCYEDGEPVKPKRITEAFQVLTKRAGIKTIRIHDLRHTHASFLLWLNVLPKVAAERLGMSIQMFNERYSHLLPTMQKQAIDVIEKAMEK